MTGGQKNKRMTRARKLGYEQVEGRIMLTGSAGDVIPDFVAAWHGVGSDHQANNDPGDTASDRHNFDDATAGGSGKNPLANGNG